MSGLSNFFGHFNTVRRHRVLVRKLCFKCGLYKQGLMHDLSKYSPVEFWNGVKFYTGTSSPHVKERATYGYSKAWLHHKGANKHHAEYWQDIMPDSTTNPIPMPTEYLVEMLCDRIAATKIYLGDNFTDKAALDYYRTHYHENNFHPDTREQLEYWLVHIAAVGVDKTLIELKKLIKEQKINKKHGGLIQI